MSRPFFENPAARLSTVLSRFRVYTERAGSDAIETLETILSERRAARPVGAKLLLPGFSGALRSRVERYFGPARTMSPRSRRWEPISAPRAA
jgi:hypothetical protein